MQDCVCRNTMRSITVFHAFKQLLFLIVIRPFSGEPTEVRNFAASVSLPNLETGDKANFCWLNPGFGWAGAATPEKTFRISGGHMTIGNGDRANYRSK